MKIKKTLYAIIENIELEIEGWYTPPEKADYNYPGAPSDFEIISVYCGSVDIYDLLYTIDAVELINCEINEQSRDESF